MTNLEHALLLLPGLVIGLTLHEFAHAWSASLLGDDYPRRLGRVSLNPLRHLSPLGTLAIFLLPIGWGRPVLLNLYNFRHPRRDYLISSLAGPAANVLLVLLGLGLMQVTRRSYLLGTGPLAVAGMGFAHVGLASVVIINASLAVLNLLPIPPLDGSKIWPCLFPGLRVVSRGKMTLGFVVLLVVLLQTRLLNPVFDFAVGGALRWIPDIDLRLHQDAHRKALHCIESGRMAEAQTTLRECLARYDARCAECRALLLATGVYGQLDARHTFPGDEWGSASLEVSGMDEDGLNAMAERLGGRGCVVRYGRMVYTWGDAAQRGDVASAAKPFYSFFLFQALEDGRIGSLDEPVVGVEPRLESVPHGRQITWRHLATQTSCYGVADAPGTAFCYSDWQMALFWDCLFARVHGATYEDVDETVLRPMLTDVLQCEDDPTFLAFGAGDRPGRLAISPRDFARFGLLFLHEGRWGMQRLLPPDTVERLVRSPLPAALPRASMEAAAMIPGQRSIGSTRVPDNQCEHLGSYSFLWWVNGQDAQGNRLWPGVPADAYGAFGHGGKRAMVVIPSLDVVVSWNDARCDGWQDSGAALRLLVEAAQVTEEEESP